MVTHMSQTVSPEVIKGVAQVGTFLHHEGSQSIGEALPPLHGHLKFGILSDTRAEAGQLGLTLQASLTQTDSAAASELTRFC